MGKWHYPKWKRVAMQAVLCVIFATSLALAQWVVHDRVVNGVTRLDAIEFFGPIGIRRPEGWSLKPPSLNATTRVTFDEPSIDGRPGRRLNITAERVTPGMAPEMYLGPGKIAGSDPETIKIGPMNGILVGRATASVGALLGLADNEFELIACGVDPNGMAVTLILRGPISTEEDVESQRQFLQENETLIRDVARGIVVRSEPGKR
jgi:hypothetical protein